MPVEIRGAEQLQTLSNALRALADHELSAAVESVFQDTGSDLVKELQRSATQTLPSRGGLNQRVAKSKFSARRVAGGVRFEAENAFARDKRKNRTLVLLNDGVVRHPVWGNTNTWVSQRVTPGWWSKPIKAVEPKLTRAVETAVLAAMKRRGL